jgi:hypothetical protein
MYHADGDKQIKLITKLNEDTFHFDDWLVVWERCLHDA